MKQQFLFVDTNIWLDFYRTKTEAGAKLLQHLDKVRGSLIFTYQLEMEFKKNRQAAILEGYRALKKPDAVPQPGIFAKAHSARALKKNIESASRHVAELQDRLILALESPSVHDPVYKVFQRCCHDSSKLKLTRDSIEKRQIKRMAFRRFLIGCPPRKSNDTSIGDSVNWEWIVHCAKSHEAEVHIASRDSDYGLTLDKKSYVNDHLLQEFHERVSKQRKLHLHSRLSEALKKFSIHVTKAEAREEEELIKSWSKAAVSSTLPVKGISQLDYDSLFSLLSSAGKTSEEAQKPAAAAESGVENVEGGDSGSSNQGASQPTQGNTEPLLGAGKGEDAK
jgi:hypothetical protein